MNIKYPLLIPIIGHGATDFIDLPKQTLIYNFLSGLLVYNLNIFQRKTLLISSSVFHIAQDIPKKIILKNKIYNIKIFVIFFWINTLFWIKNHIIANYIYCVYIVHYIIYVVL